MSLWSFFLAVTGKVFRYLGHAHLLYRRQGPSIGTEKQQELITQSYKVQIMPLVIYSLGGGYTHKRTDIPHKSDFRKPGACQPAACCGWIEARLSFAVIRATDLCLWGSSVQ